MSTPLEDYALIGDTHTAALVSRDGSIDWLCLPRFDSGACFAALLGDRRHGNWSLRPHGEGWRAERRYRGDSLVLETTFSRGRELVRVLDCMPPRDGHPQLVRRVEGVSGQVRMTGELAPRHDYGHIVPWVRASGRRWTMLAGSDRLIFDADPPSTLSTEDSIRTEFTVGPREKADFRLSWGTGPEPEQDLGAAIDDTERWWCDWAARCAYDGPYREAVVRSLLTLKALTYAPTGGIVAAPTTSLPERLGGDRNWDYRYCWLRDATFTLLALLDGGYEREAKEWREWLLRAVAGRPEQMQILYGVDGGRRLPELELDWLPGYAGSRPVRVGNAAAGQYQLDNYGEVMDALHQARVHGLPLDEDTWRLQGGLMNFLEGNWREPDNGIWESRGPRRHYTHSKVMAWAAADRAVRAVAEFGLAGPADRWRRLRQDIFDEVCTKGYDSTRNTFVQHFGGTALDAALLTIPNVGFLPADDERVRGTVAAVEKHLADGPLVWRFADDGGGGLPAGEGAFLACSFWLADSYVLRGDKTKGQELFEQTLALRNDVGLLSEEYDPLEHRLVGNFPQALAHIPLVNTAFNLAGPQGPAQRRANTGR